MKDWNREDAIKTRAKILSGRYVDYLKGKLGSGVQESLPRTKIHLRLQLHRMLTTRH